MLQESGVEVSGQAGTAEELLSEVEAHAPDGVLERRPYDPAPTVRVPPDREGR